MSFENFLSSLNEELNQNKTPKSINKKYNFNSNFDLLTTVRNEITEDNLDEIDLKAVGQKIGKAASGVVGKVKEALSKLYEKIKGKVRSIEKVGFTLGSAIVQLVKGGFGLMNKKGDIVTQLKYEKIERTKLPGSKKDAVVGTTHTPNGVYNIAFQPDGNMAFAWQEVDEHKHFNIVLGDISEPSEKVENRILKNLGLLTEAKSKDGEDEDNEEEEIDYEAMDIKLHYNPEDRGKFIGVGPKTRQLISDPDAARIKDMTIKASEISSIIENFIERFEHGGVSEGKFPSIFIFGPTGVGKTEIVESLAKKSGWKIEKLELAQIDPDMVKGIPKVGEDDTGPVVQIVPSKLLPREGKNILFFDEFNRAKLDVQNAVMNLILKGELKGAKFSVMVNGKKVETQYKVPPNTIFVATGNTKGQVGAGSENAVRDLDLATGNRFDQYAKVEYDAHDWLKNWATLPMEVKPSNEKEDSYFVLQRVPTVITNYIEHLVKKAGTGSAAKAAPFMMPFEVHSGEGGVGGTTEPRRWDKLATAILSAARTKWNKMEDKEKDEYLPAGKTVASILLKKPENKITDEEAKKYAFAGFYEDKDFVFDFLKSGEATRILGEKGIEYIRDMFHAWSQFHQKKFSAADLIFNYLDVRDEVKKEGGLFESAGNILGKMIEPFFELKTIDNVLGYMKHKGWKIAKPSLESDPVIYFAIVINTIITDLLKLGKLKADHLEDFVGKFFEVIHDEKKAKKYPIIKSIHSKLYGSSEKAGVSEDYRKAYQSQIKRVEQSEEEFKKAKKSKEKEE
jgi:MoxR-like ATPase